MVSASCKRKKNTNSRQLTISVALSERNILKSLMGYWGFGCHLPKSNRDISSLYPIISSSLKCFLQILKEGTTKGFPQNSSHLFCTAISFGKEKREILFLFSLLYFVEQEFTQHFIILFYYSLYLKIQFLYFCFNFFAWNFQLWSINDKFEWTICQIFPHSSIPIPPFLISLIR